MVKSLTPEAIEQRRFARTVLLLLILGFAAVIAAGLSAVAVVVRSQDQAGLIDHTYQVQGQVAQIRLSLEAMRSARRGSLLKLREDSGAIYADASARFFSAIDSVGVLTRDNPVQRRNMVGMRRLAKQVDGLFAASMLTRTTHSDAIERERQSVAARVQRLTEAMQGEEAGLLTRRTAAQRDSIRSFYIVLGVTGALLAIVGFGSIWVIRRYTSELNQSRETLRLLNENLEDAVAVRTVDLQRANDEIQRFAYIVSHDLRSPLVNVMGFTAELDASIKPLAALIADADEKLPGLVSTEARLAVAEDLPESVGFIRTSTQKMDRLINAILRLSREGRRTITPEKIDLALLSNGVVDALRHRIDELGVTVTIADQMPAIVSDRLAIEQIVSNIVENAVKYLKPGRPGTIDISAVRKANRVTIFVKDNGRGVDPRDHQRIFDLFRRSGPQDQPGEGIGLAHVRALAYRLGGTIDIESALGEGATFRINLPVDFVMEKTSA